MKNVIQTLASMIVVSAAVATCAYLVIQYLDTPVVSITHYTQRCVGVEPPGEWSCTKLPPKYTTQYVAETYEIGESK